MPEATEDISFKPTFASTTLGFPAHKARKTLLSGGAMKVTEAGVPKWQPVRSSKGCFQAPCSKKGQWNFTGTQALWSRGKKRAAKKYW